MRFAPRNLGSPRGRRKCRQLPGLGRGDGGRLVQRRLVDVEWQRLVEQRFVGQRLVWLVEWQRFVEQRFVQHERQQFFKQLRQLWVVQQRVV